ncbi:predicted protein, partial [Postia placenta Mad-698-R]
QHCTCPDNSEPHCTKDDPCGWHCKPPYVKKDGQCVCPAPYTECNGKCGSWPHVSTVLMNAGVLTVFLFGVCGVYGGSSRSFECLDVDTALESCGGCMIQNPFIGSTNGSSYGIDCTTIVGANDVACVGGKCTVTSCASGYRVSNNRDGCKAVE